MVSVELIKSLTRLNDVEEYIKIGNKIITEIPGLHNADVVKNWTTLFFPALEKQKRIIMKRTRHCYGCEHDLCGQRDHMGGCLLGYGESWSD